MKDITNLRQALRFLAIAKEKIKTLEAEIELSKSTSELGHSLFAKQLIESDRLSHQVDAHSMTLVLSEARIIELEESLASLQTSASIAYGHLWHIQEDPCAPKPMYPAFAAAKEARKCLLNTLTPDQRLQGIQAVAKEVYSKTPPGLFDDLPPDSYF